LGGGVLFALAGAAVWTIGYSLTMTKHQGEWTTLVAGCRL